mmetsp:Transcript_58486/g.118960  ORF Transcript_58486/g.118960 Transcript_58486/m.118960 type:complete len:94 (-) Transcript_58486:407-688(-)
MITFQFIIFSELSPSFKSKINVISKFLLHWKLSPSFKIQDIRFSDWLNYKNSFRSQAFISDPSFKIITFTKEVNFEFSDSLILPFQDINSEVH